MTRPGKRIAVAIVLVGMAIGILAVLLLAPALREKWYLRPCLTWNGIELTTIHSCVIRSNARSTRFSDR